VNGFCADSAGAAPAGNCRRAALLQVTRVAVEDLRRLAAWSRGSERRVERVERPVAPEQKAHWKLVGKARDRVMSQLAAAVHQRGAGGRAARRANVRHVYIHVVSHSRRTVRGGAATQRKGSSGYTERSVRKSDIYCIAAGRQGLSTRIPRQ